MRNLSVGQDDRDCVIDKVGDAEKPATSNAKNKQLISL
jgi:hypothetical protein